MTKEPCDAKTKSDLVFASFVSLSRQTRGRNRTRRACTRRRWRLQRLRATSCVVTWAVIVTWPPRSARSSYFFFSSRRRETSAGTRFVVAGGDVGEVNFSDRTRDVRRSDALDFFARPVRRRTYEPPVPRIFECRRVLFSIRFETRVPRVIRPLPPRHFYRRARGVPYDKRVRSLHGLTAKLDLPRRVYAVFRRTTQTRVTTKREISRRSRRSENTRRDGNKSRTRTVKTVKTRFHVFA